MGVDAGRLNHCFRLEQPNASEQSGYSEVDRVWGSIEYVGGSAEAMRSGSPLGSAAHRIHIYYRTDVRAKWRLIDRETDRTFEIVSFGDPDGRREQLRLLCSEDQ